MKVVVRIIPHPNGAAPCELVSYSTVGICEAVGMAILLNKQIRGIKNMRVEIHDRKSS